ncbi:MAG TPA: hypothetical protein VLH08_20560, partial [Acidobacteriota bacterium]|nr:hypothetical protein [Acidobacteriota bacterium]
MKTKLFVLFAFLAVAVLALQMEAEAVATCKICAAPNLLGVECVPQTEVELSEHPLFGAETTYWVVYDANETISSAKVVMKFTSDSGLLKTVDKFDFPSGGGGAVKAFSLSGSILGPAV